MDYLTDSDPRKWDREQLIEPARAVLVSEQPHDEQGWFVSSYALGLALLLVGETASATELMEISIGCANDLSESDPNAILLGVEAWLNRVDLERSVSGEDAYVEALEATYGLLAGSSVSSRHLFGLDIARIRLADPVDRSRALNAVRNRVQASLLKQLMRMDDHPRALRFAERVAGDYPNAVQMGVLEPIEIITILTPSHPLLIVFSPLNPRAEGDFVVHLRLLESVMPAGMDNDLRRCDFEQALSAFEATHSFRNPCTPFLWRVHHAFVAGDEEGQRVAISDALRECARSRDLRSHQRVVAQAREHLGAAGVIGIEFAEGEQPGRAEVVELFERFVASQPAKFARHAAPPARKRASIL